MTKTEAVADLIAEAEWHMSHYSFARLDPGTWPVTMLKLVQALKILTDG